MIAPIKLPHGEIAAEGESAVFRVRFVSTILGEARVPFPQLPPLVEVLIDPARVRHAARPVDDPVRFRTWCADILFVFVWFWDFVFLFRKIFLYIFFNILFFF